MFYCYLKNGQVLTFENKCNEVAYKDSHYCIFSQVDGPHLIKVFGIVPHDVILYVLKVEEKQ